MGRVVVVEQVYYQGEGMPMSIEPGYTVPTGDEQPFLRYVTVGETPSPLDCAWLKECSSLVIWNRTGEGLQVNPSTVERDAIAASVVEVLFGGGQPLLLNPGESLRVRPSDLSTVSLRCRKGAARVIIHAFPK